VQASGIFEDPRRERWVSRRSGEGRAERARRMDDTRVQMAAQPQRLSSLPVGEIWVASSCPVRHVNFQ